MLLRKLFILSFILFAGTLAALPQDEDWDVDDGDDSDCCCCDEYEEYDQDWYQYHVDEGWPGRREDTWFDNLER